MNNHISNLSIKRMSEEDRPREKALAKGIDALTNAELLAVLLGTGMPGLNVVDLCQYILSDNENKLYRLARRSVKDLMRYEGIGEVKALNILAALELGRRIETEEFEQSPEITTIGKACNYLRHKMSHMTSERFAIIILDHAKHAVDFRVISEGGKAATVVDIKKVMRTALEYDADSILIAHNHPSNNPRPSKQDDELTKKLVDAGKALDIPVIDHIIVTQGECYSYLEHGRM